MSTALAYPPPATEADLNALAARLERATQSIEALTTLVMPLLAVAADSADEFVSRADARGVHIDARLHDAVVLLERLTAPNTMRVLTVLLDRLPQLEQLLTVAEQAPGMVALGVDAMDEVMRDLQDKGVDNVVTLIGRMGASLATAANTKPAPVGLFGLLGALNNPDVKHALGLLLTFAAELGRQLDHGSRGRANS